MKKKLTLQELVDLVAEKTGETKQFSQDFIHELPDIIQHGLRRDGQVNLKGLGIFRLKWVKARTGRNPQTGEKIRIPGRYRIVYKPDKELREYVNRKYAHLKPKMIKGRKAEIIHWDSSESDATRKRNKRPIWWAAAALLILLFAAWIFTQKEPENIEFAQNSPSPEPTTKENTTSNSREQETAETNQKDLDIPTKKVQSDKLHPVASNSDHTIEPGENLWSLAVENYENGFYWPNIYRVNYEQIPNPDYIYPGLILRIPALQGTPTNLTRRDSADIAQGYYITYIAYKNLSFTKADKYLQVSKKFNALNHLNEDQYEVRVLAQIEKGQ